MDVQALPVALFQATGTFKPLTMDWHPSEPGVSSDTTDTRMCSEMSEPPCVKPCGATQ